MTECVLVEMDYKSLEAQLVGYFAEDPGYIKAAKLGVHSILMARVKGVEVNVDDPPDKVKKILKQLKTDDPIAYDSCKHVVHGSNYLGTPRRLRLGWPDLFESVGAAKKIQDLYFETIASKVRRWQQKVLHEAYQVHYLENPYCIDLNTLVLKEDLTWVPADTLVIGDTLIGFDEDGPLRRYKPSVVEAVETINQPRVQVCTQHGDIIVSENHMFLVRKTHSSGDRYRWVCAKDLSVADQIGYLATPWKSDVSWEGGWLSGMLDGEGSLAYSGPTSEGWYQQSHIQLSQKAGPTADKIGKVLAAKGFNFTRKQYKNDVVETFWLRGGLPEKLRLLGSIRPERLLTKAYRTWGGARVWGANPAVVQGVTYLGQGPVLSIKTSSSTLITNGFLSHNCYRHYFWDVLHYVGQQLEWGVDAKKAVAFLPQSTGAGLISEAILRIYYLFPDVFQYLRWMIHDSLVAEAPIIKLPHVIGVIKACMEYPEERLGGLSVEVETSIGKNWGEMVDYEGEIEEVRL